MENSILIIRILIKLLIAVGLLCLILNGIAVLVFWIISAGVNIYDFIKAKK